jgi:hypothetical protein
VLPRISLIDLSAVEKFHLKIVALLNEDCRTPGGRLEASDGPNDKVYPIPTPAPQTTIEAKSTLDPQRLSCPLKGPTPVRFPRESPRLQRLKMPIQSTLFGDEH